MGTSRDFDAPTSLAAISPTTSTEQQMLSLIERLFHENDSLRREVGQLKTEVNIVKAQLASFTSTSPHHRNPARGWHEEARTRIGATDSRSAPTHAYHCAHHGCDWRNKRVTLQAYVLHLQRKHRVKIADNPDVALLPVRAT